MSSMFSNDQDTLTHANEIVKEYLRIYPETEINEKISKLFTSDTSITSRKNIFGHITASAIVLDSTLSKILLVEHKKLGKFIQPGGHIDEADASFCDAAKREVTEETGYRDLMYIPVFEKNDVPIDIDIHIIPENPKKNESEHFHFDFRFVFVLESDNQGSISEDEIDGYGFVPIKEIFIKDESLSRVAKKVEMLVSKKRDYIYFERLFGKYDLSNCNVVAVQHIVSDILPFMFALKSRVKSLTIIPKPNSVSEHVCTMMQDFHIVHISREELKGQTVLSKLFPKNQKSLVIDIGGYFATEEFFSFCTNNPNVLGVVEDTENGLQKYEKLFVHINPAISVFSVARSELKQNEDDLVGYSVAYYTEMITRKYRVLPRYVKTGILGYGKLGKGIAKYLFNQNCKPFVYDTNPLRLVEAMKDGCIPIQKNELIKSSAILFSATGSRSLTFDELKNLQSGAFIASVTSSEYEFGFECNNDNICTVIKSDRFVSEVLLDNKSVYLINNGNAVNFIDKDADRVGDFIRLVQSEIIEGLNELCTKKQQGIKTVSVEQKNRIANLFLEIYGGY